MRAAMTLLKWPESETRRLGSSIHDLRDKLRLCSRCGALTDTDPCTVCADPARDDSLLCLVAEWDSMLTLEEGAFFRGRYLILGGLLPPPNMAGESPDLDRLLDRLAEGQVREVILALGATVEGENTAEFIRGLVSRRFPGVRVTRLAQGIPLGAEVTRHCASRSSTGRNCVKVQEPSRSAQCICAALCRQSRQPSSFEIEKTQTLCSEEPHNSSEYVRFFTSKRRQLRRGTSQNFQPFTVFNFP